MQVGNERKGAPVQPAARSVHSSLRGHAFKRSNVGIAEVSAALGIPGLRNQT